MSNTSNIRQRSSAKNGACNGAIHILRDVSESSGASTVIRKTNKTLHNSVWNRLIAIVVLFTILALFTSRIERYEQSVGRGTGNSGSVRAGGRDGLSFVTIVMPSVVNPDARPARLMNIAKTWGNPSHAIYIVHDAKEYPEGVGVDKSNKIYPQNLLLPNHITVEKGVERLEYVIRTIHKEIDPDFAFFVNDHTFVLPYHLCQFLQEHDSSKDLYAGHALKGQKETSFNSGAAGYVLSRSTMQRLIKEWDNPNSSCSLGNASKWLQGNPGLLTAQCFDQVLHIPVVDTRDKLDLSHKFHAYGLIRTVSGNIDDWYMNKHKTLDDIFGVDKTYHHLPQDGAKCCSANSISFHYVEAGESIVFWEVLQKLHESPAMSDVEIKDLMNEVWPKDRLGFGGYSQKLPPPEQSIWSDIMQVVRKIAVGVEPPSC